MRIRSWFASTWFVMRGGETWPIDDPYRRSSTSEDPVIAPVLLRLILVPSLLLTTCSAEALKLKPGRTRARRLEWISEISFFMWLRFMVAILTWFEAALKVHRRDQRWCERTGFGIFAANRLVDPANKSLIKTLNSWKRSGIFQIFPNSWKTSRQSKRACFTS